MKKIISLILVVGLLLALCACGAQEQPEATEATVPVEVEATEATEAPTEGFVLPIIEKEEISYDDVNELEPVDGWYQIHSIVGVQNIANHPDAKFNVLCDIDLGGVTLEPIGSKAAPFTGQM